jgi:predicted enzyme related to lactoylglutathione lyase
MPVPSSFRAGEPCWLDLVTSKPEAAIDFYGGLFGWTVEPTPQQHGDYRNFIKDGRRVAGLANSANDLDDGWLVYLAVPDTDATAAAVRDAGGTVLVSREFPGLGRMLVARDATGAQVGAWQSGDHPGFGLAREPGTPVWQELHARDYAAAVDFYERAFGWQTSVLGDGEELRFTTLGEGADAAAGIMDAGATLPEIAPSSWMAYFGVDDANDAAVRVTELGGAMLEAIEDTPYGRMAQAADSSGNLFSIMQVD